MNVKIVLDNVPYNDTLSNKLRICIGKTSSSRTDPQANRQSRNVLCASSLAKGCHHAMINMKKSYLLLQCSYVMKKHHYR